jgi:hypothetical protein
MQAASWKARICILITFPISGLGNLMIGSEAILQALSFADRFRIAWYRLPGTLSPPDT